MSVRQQGATLSSFFRSPIKSKRVVNVDYPPEWIEIFQETDAECVEPNQISIIDDVLKEELAC